MGMKVATKEAIDRLAALKLDGDSGENLSAICSVIYGRKPEFGWTVGACSALRQILINWLEQYDPAEWADSYLVEQDLMRLPVDADGVPIHEGDTVYDATGQRLVAQYLSTTVVCSYTKLTDNGKYIDEVGYVSHVPNTLVHHRPTLEELLGEALNEAAMLDRQEGYWPSAADITNIVNSLADKLQLKGCDA
jgi:hypothetical protein